MSMNNNNNNIIINLATSPALDAYIDVSNSIASDVTETYDATITTIEPKAHVLEATARKLDYLGEVNFLPHYKVTCN